MRLYKWIWALFLSVGLGSIANAAENAAVAGHGAAGAAHGAAHVDEGVPIAAPVLCGWFKGSNGVEFLPAGAAGQAISAGKPLIFAITNSMVAMGIVALGLIVFAQLATRNIQMVPKGLQNFAEWVIESLQDFLGGILGPKLVKQTFWYFATVFLFILSANWFGLLPGVGTVGWGSAGAHGFHVSEPVLRGHTHTAESDQGGG